MSCNEGGVASRLFPFAKERDTKNTVRFQEDEREGETEVIGTLYVKKHAAKDAETLTVTIEFPNDKAKK